MLDTGVCYSYMVDSTCCNISVHATAVTYQEGEVVPHTRLYTSDRVFQFLLAAGHSNFCLSQAGTLVCQYVNILACEKQPS